MTQIHELSACKIRDKIASGELTAVEVTQHYLDRIDRLDGDVKAFLCTFPEQALAQAQAIDIKREEGVPLGKMAGVPVAIKDNIHIEGELTTCASKFLGNFRAPFEATVTRLLREADAILIGKTNLDEFAMGSSTEHSAVHATNNPWNLKCSPGGSSGGSAAAVAARLVPLSLGSDTGGSIRQPASFCGILGMKPSYGRVSRYGLVAFGSSLDQIGPFATTAEDIGLIMEVMGQHCPNDSTSLDKPGEEYLTAFPTDLMGKKIGIPTSFLKGLDGEARDIFENGVRKLEELGAETVEVDLDLLKHSTAVYYILATAEASTNLARFDGVRYGQRSERAETLADVYDFSRQEGFGAEVKRRIMLGTFVLSAGYQDAYYRKAQKVRTLIIEQYNAAFDKCDIIAMPTCPGATFERGSKKDPVSEYLEDLYTISANLAGLPAISVPSGFTSDNRPIGFQLTGPQLEDVRVCHYAHAFEKAAAVSDKMPELVR